MIARRNRGSELILFRPFLSSVGQRLQEDSKLSAPSLDASERPKNDNDHIGTRKPKNSLEAKPKTLVYYDRKSVSLVQGKRKKSIGELRDLIVNNKS